MKAKGMHSLLASRIDEKSPLGGGGGPSFILNKVETEDT